MRISTAEALRKREIGVELCGFEAKKEIPVHSSVLFVA
jgi:hypothetical protein